jgi:hypothetical protein
VNGQACSQGFKSLELGTQLSLSQNGADAAPGGSIDNGNGNSDPGSGTPNSPIVVPTPVAVNCTDPGMRGASKSGIRRLNKIELGNATRSLIQGYYPAIEDALNAYPDVIEVSEVSNFAQIYSLEQMQQWALLTDLIANTAKTDGNVRYQMAGDCFKSSSITEDCWDKFYKEYGKRVYRRPLTTDDINFLREQRKGLSSEDAVYKTVSILLRSPDFLFHLESGSSEEANRVRLTDYEVANRISFALTASPPDAELLKAADAGLLKTLAQVEAQARRIAQTKGAQEKLKGFFAEWLQYDHFAGADYLLTDAGSQTRFGGGDMRTDVNDYLNEVVWRQSGSFKTLMTSPTVFARNPSYRNAYSLQSFDESGKTSYQSPNHPGLLTRVGFLSNQGTYSSPIRRGVFVQRRILCVNMPTPDFSVVALRLDEIGKLSGMDHSNAELTTKRTNDSACIGCHASINPMGFALEAYDALGIYRNKETYIEWSSMYASPQVPYYPEIPGTNGKINYHGVQHNLPYPVANVTVDAGKQISVGSPQDLANGIGESGQAMSCMTKFVLRHFERRAETTGDLCLINEVTSALKSGAPVSDAFVKVLANEDIFWRAK